MLTFLRRIRKSLLDSGATSKYLLYAVGEIALVVIGILIALQINNWNEWRKDRQIERTLLYGLMENINTNSQSIVEKILELENSNKSREIIMNVIENQTPYSDTLDIHFENNVTGSVMGLYLTEAGFEALSNIGLHVIESDSLRLHIVELFQTTYGKTRAIIDDAKQVIFAWIAPLDSSKKRFSDSIEKEGIVPVDYDSFTSVQNE